MPETLYKGSGVSNRRRSCGSVADRGPEHKLSLRFGSDKVTCREYNRGEMRSKNYVLSTEEK